MVILEQTVASVPHTQSHLLRMVSTLEADYLRAQPPNSLEQLEQYAEGSSSQLLYLQVMAYLRPAAHQGILFIAEGGRTALCTKTGANLCSASTTIGSTLSKAARQCGAPRQLPNLAVPAPTVSFKLWLEKQLQRVKEVHQDFNVGFVYGLH